MLQHMARSSSGLGRRPLKAEITGSNPVRATIDCSGLLRESFLLYSQFDVWLHSRFLILLFGRILIQRKKVQNLGLRTAGICRNILSCATAAAERDWMHLGMSSNGRTADSGSVNGGSTPSIPASASYIWPVRLAVQDAALSRRRSPVRIRYGLPRILQVIEIISMT